MPAVFELTGDVYVAQGENFSVYPDTHGCTVGCSDFFISKMYFDFQQKLGKHKGVAAGMLVDDIDKTVASLKI